MARGRFIVFEGIDGSGTTSQVGLLLDRWLRQGIPVRRTAEPSSGPVGRLVRTLLGQTAAGFDPHAMALLFAADRRDHLCREVLPLLEEGVHVVCDRYLMSSLVYQVAAGVPRAFVEQANAGVRPPDLTLLLSVPPQIGAARRRARAGAVEIYDDADTQERVAQAYAEEAARLSRSGAAVQVLDGGGTLEQVAAEIDRALQTCLALPATAPS